jgi:hypothetical protein
MYSMSASSGSRMVVEHLQLGLKIFQCFPVIEQIESVFSNRLMKTLQNFQQFVNSSKMPKEKVKKKNENK